MAKIIFSILLYSSGTLAPFLEQFSVGVEEQMDNGGLGPQGALKRAPKGSKMPIWLKNASCSSVLYPSGTPTCQSFSS